MNANRVGWGYAHGVFASGSDFDKRGTIEEMRLIAKPAVTASYQVYELGWLVVSSMLTHLHADPRKIQDSLKHLWNVRSGLKVEASDARACGGRLV
jgi:hypothetical protein